VHEEKSAQFKNIIHISLCGDIYASVCAYVQKGYVMDTHTESHSFPFCICNMCSRSRSLLHLFAR